MSVLSPSCARQDLELVRDLAGNVMGLATSRAYEARRHRWRNVNERRATDRAPVWCRPAGAWRELLPPSALRCRDPLCRQFEFILRQHLYKDWVGDDHLLEPWWEVPAVFRCQSRDPWGLPVHRSLGTTEQGGFCYSHPVESEADYTKVTVPDFAYDREATERAASQAHDVLGEAMPIRITGSPPLGPHLGTYLEQLRGMVPLMEDLATCPHLVHRTMAKLTEGVLRAIRVADEAGVLCANHHEPMFCSAPLNGAAADPPVRPHQLWVAANSQEFDQVSPVMFEEFLLSYQRVLFQQYGAVQYGCCENLTAKIDRVLTIPNLRTFVCSFWTDLDRVITACGTSHTIMWRQSAAQVTLPASLDEHSRHLESGLSRLRGCHYQIVLREVETLNGRPDRLRDWARLAIDLAGEFA